MQTLDAQLVGLLYRLGPVQLRVIMSKVARYLRDQNAARIEAQRNGDGSTYAPRQSGSRRKMLVGYSKRIKTRMNDDLALVGVFGRMGGFGAVHDQGQTERGISYPRRNILSLPDADKTQVITMIQQYLEVA